MSPNALLAKAALAARAGVSPDTIRRAEAGLSLSPLAEERLARALGKERSELFPWSEKAEVS